MVNSLPTNVEVISHNEIDEKIIPSPKSHKEIIILASGLSVV